MIDTRLAGRIALVTGSNRQAGIGSAVARGLAREGAAVAVTMPKGEADELSAEVVEEIRQLGVASIGVPVDLSDVHQCADLFSEVERRLGSVEILINNAAHCVPDSLCGHPRPLDADTLDHHHAVNVRAPALLMRMFYDSRRWLGAHWGRIINVSTDGAPGFAGEVSYGATKSALESLSRAAALEFAHLGITVNIISPGPIQTGWYDDAEVQAAAAATPLGRIGVPDDVADVAVFLASEQARWVTGQTLYVGGGHRMI